MQIPEALLSSLEGIKGFNRESFQQVHDSGEQVTSVRINPSKIKETSLLFPGIEVSSIPWAGQGYYLSARPSFTFDPLFHAGCYYVQEASSMFLEQVLLQSVDISKPLRVLDLCAAPGGKSTHLQSLLSKESLLVSNEVIRSRAAILKDNIIKWGGNNVVVTNNDPSAFSKLENFFDVIVVDAPCSGSGLFRRDEEAIEEWSGNNVLLCSQRQQRILADVLPALKKGGVLIYSTCSYSEEEDEDIAKWINEEFPMDYSPLTADPDLGITDTGCGYRFWPDKVKGEGFFISCFRKTDGEDLAKEYKGKRKTVASKADKEIISKWIKEESLSYIRHENAVYAIPEQRVNDINQLLETLKVLYSGTLLGELIRDKLVPDHALALSPLLSDQVARKELNGEEAIKYLKRKDLQTEFIAKGWQVVSCRGFPLGWVNVLPNRINNYYPKELRILKDN